MARFQVPSVSPPSTPGSQGSGSPSGSPSTPPVYTNGPNTFRVPSSHGTPTTSGRGSRSPSGSPSNPRSVPGSFNGSSLPQGSQDANRFKRSRSPSPETPASQRRRHNFWPARSAGRPDDGFFRNGTPVPRGVAYNGSGDPSSNSSSSSDESDHVPNGGGNGGDDKDFNPSDHTDTDLDEQEQWMPLVAKQPERLPGRKFGGAQPFPAQSLTLLKERPGRLPAHTARSPTSPGFDWGDGAAWWFPAGSNGREDIAREIFTETGYKVIEQDVAEATADLMNHENLVNMLDGDGFGEDQREVRQEVLYEFCSGGTLNKLILSRKPETPILKPRRPASYLPTKEIVLGLPEDLVWHVLLSLLRATYWLHHRQQPVVHCAIDPANIFFTAPQPNDLRPLVRRYGLVKLGNFSKAVILPHRHDPDRNDDDEIQDRCEMFEHMITEPYAETGYEAPELLGMLGEDEVSAEKIFPGPCSDLFSIGVTCFAMMTGKTIWDLLLERRFITRSQTPDMSSSAVLEEKWRFSEYDERMEMVKTMLQGKQKAWQRILGDALPGFYSEQLRGVVKGLLNLDPEMRGESSMLLDEVEEAFEGKCAEANGNGLREMRRVWRAATRAPTAREDMDRVIREAEEGSELVRALGRQLQGPQPPLVP